MSKKWPGESTVQPAELIAHYKKDRTWERTRFFYETWRKTTAMIGPPHPWDDLDARTQIAFCAVAHVVAEDARDSD